MVYAELSLTELMVSLLLIIFFGYVIPFGVLFCLTKIFLRLLAFLERSIDFIFTRYIYSRNIYTRDSLPNILDSISSKKNIISEKVDPLFWILLIIIVFFRTDLSSLILSSLTSSEPKLETYTNPLLIVFVSSVIPSVGLVCILYILLLVVYESIYTTKQLQRQQVSKKGIEIFIVSRYANNLTSIIGFLLLIGIFYFGLLLFVFQALLPVWTQVDFMLNKNYDITLFVAENYLEYSLFIQDLPLKIKDVFIPYLLIMQIIIFGSLSIPYLYFKGWKFLSPTIIILVFTMAFTSFVSKIIYTYLSINYWILGGSLFVSYFALKMLFTLIQNLITESQIICPHCKAENTIKAKYCELCGKELIS